MALMIKAHEIAFRSHSTKVRKLIIQSAWMEIFQSRALLSLDCISHPRPIFSFPSFSESNCTELIQFYEENLVGRPAFSLSGLVLSVHDRDFDPEAPPLIFFDEEDRRISAQMSRADYLDDIPSLNQKFDVKVLRENLSVLNSQAKMYDVARYLEWHIRKWRNPFLSGLIYLVLVMLVVFDLLNFLPSLLLFLNCLLLIFIQRHPESFSRFYKRLREDAITYKLYLSKGKEVKSTQHDDSFEEAWEQNSLKDKSGFSEKDIDAQKSARNSLKILRGVEIFREVKKKMVSRLDELEVLQNNLAKANYRLLQFQGLYFWVSPEHTWFFFLVCLIGSIALFLIPFRWIFGLAGKICSSKFVYSFFERRIFFCNSSSLFHDWALQFRKGGLFEKVSSNSSSSRSPRLLTSTGEIQAWRLKTCNGLKSFSSNENKLTHTM